jgi:hypothetical protein
MDHANFPDKWKCKVKNPQDEHGGQHTSRGGGSHQRGVEQSTFWMGYAPGFGEHIPCRDFSGNQGQYRVGGQGYFGNIHQGPMGAHQGGQPQQGGPTSTRDWRTGGNYQRNPKIKTMIQPYLECTGGRVYLREILNAAGKCQTDFPMLQKYVHATERPFLCWSSVLGCRTFRDCWFKKEGSHPSTTDIIRSTKQDDGPKGRDPCQSFTGALQSLLAVGFELA